MSLANSNYGWIDQGRDFRTTRWSVVLLARQDQSVQGEQALEQLCRSYWYPIYSFIRRQGHDSPRAQDLTQGFFAKVLEKKYLSDADAARGKFRSFLLASVKHYLSNEWDYITRLKRGGGNPLLSLDEEAAEGRYQAEPASHETPDKLYDRRWVEALLELVLTRLRSEIAGQGHEKRFDQLKIFLVDEKGAVSFSEIATRLGMTEAAVKGVVRRMRKRFRELFREEIAHTVASPEQIDEEIRSLIALMAR